MFVMNCWYVAAWSHDVPAGTLYPMMVAGLPMVLYRDAEGRAIALEDRCCHRTAPLSKGRIEDGCNVRCMYHGFKFATDGRCIEIPGETSIPSLARVASYPAMDRHGWIWVWPGNPAKADPSLIPAAIGVGHPDFIMKPGHMDYAANYELINDNLTDFSHLSYVHAKSFGSSDNWASSRPHVERLERGIRVTRCMSIEDAMSADGPSALRGNEDSASALFETYDYLAPGILLMYSAYHRKSELPEDGRSRPTAAPSAVQWTSQAVTPMTEQTTRYFYTWGPRRTDPGAEELADQLMGLGAMAFAEDRDIIEAQQRSLNLGPRRQILTSADLGPGLMRRVIKELAAANDPPK